MIEKGDIKMEKKQISNEQMKSIVTAAILFVIGVLFCCSLTFGARGLSWLIGVSISITGIMFLINTVKARKSIANLPGFLGAVLIGFGIMFILERMANIIISFIPWGLIAVGATLATDAFLVKFVKKNATTARFVVELVLGLLTAALGICLKVISGFADYAAAMLGAFMIVYAILMVFNALTKKETVDAE